MSERPHITARGAGRDATPMPALGDGERLLYVMGPSGAGKDSVLAAALAILRREEPLRLARRTVARPHGGASAADETVSLPQMRRWLSEGEFALHWEAHGCLYGIRWSALEPWLAGDWVLINGSRAHWLRWSPQVPAAHSICITAPEHVLRERLLRRGRDSGSQVETRMARYREFEGLPADLVLRNEGDVARTAQALVAWWRGLLDGKTGRAARARSAA